MVEANEGEDKEVSNSLMISKSMEGISKINRYFYIELFKWFRKLKYEISFDFFYIYEPISGMNKGGQQCQNIFLLHSIVSIYSGAKLFNMLPLQMRETKNPNTFKKHVKRLDMEKHPLILINFFIAVL